MTAIYVQLAGLRAPLPLRNGKRLLAILTIAIGAAGGAAGTAQAETTTVFNTTTQPIPTWQAGQRHAAPSIIGVRGVEGPITDVDLYLNALDSKDMSRLHFLLVSPSGESEVVMSSNCSDDDVDNRFLTFDQSAAGVMPRNDEGECPLDAYKPSDGYPSTAYPFEGLPGGPTYTHNFDNFDNENANGIWSLYAFTSCIPCAADQLEGGWALRIETGPIALDLPGGTLTQGPADPYPQTLNLPEGKLITDLNVYVNGVFHNGPDDIDMVLEKVNGPRVMLMSDACGEYGVNAYGWRFDDEAPAPMPDSGTTNICGATAHQPTNHGGVADLLPAPAPPGPYATSLSAFDLTQSGGEYRLWVNDDANGREGFFTHKFQLEMETRSPAPTAFTVSELEVGEGETGELTVRRSGSSSYASGSVAVQSVADSARSIHGDYNPVYTVLEFGPGETEETVEVRVLEDGETEVTETFMLKLVSPSGDVAPSGGPATVVIPANRDATPPETEITKRPPRRTDAHRAKFAFTSSESDSTFKCKLDRRRFKRCESPVRLKRLSPGRHRFRVRATDAAGNTDPTPASARWRVTR